MSRIIYRPYAKSDEDAVIAHILAIQQGEFAVPVTAEEQPDLRAVAEVYQSGTGGFWVAERDGRIVGTIGLIGFAVALWLHCLNRKAADELRAWLLGRPWIAWLPRAMERAFRLA